MDLYGFLLNANFHLLLLIIQFTLNAVILGVTHHWDIFRDGKQFLEKFFVWSNVICKNVFKIKNKTISSQFWKKTKQNSSKIMPHFSLNRNHYDCNFPCCYHNTNWNDSYRRRSTRPSTRPSTKCAIMRTSHMKAKDYRKYSHNFLSHNLFVLCSFCRVCKQVF